MKHFIPDNRAYYRDGKGDSFYRPCLNGLHICGCSELPNDEQPYTWASYPIQNIERARLLFKQAKLAASCDETEGYFIIDLMIDGDCVDDFHSNGQLLPTIEQIIVEGLV